MSERYRRDAALPFQEIQGETVVVVPARRALHRLEDTEAFLWAELAKPRSLADLVGAVCDEFEVEPGVAEADVKEFLLSLEANGLVQRA